jgi:hypothetical protein
LRLAISRVTWRACVSAPVEELELELEVEVEVEMEEEVEEEEESSAYRGVHLPDSHQLKHANELLIRPISRAAIGPN